MKSKHNKEQGTVTSQWKYLNIIDYLLPAYVILSIPLFYLGLDYGFVFKGVSIIVTLFYLIKFGVPNNSSTKLFSFFLLLVSFSFIQYIYNNRPIVLFFDDASNYIAAMLFFYIGASDERPGRPFYKKMMFSIAVVFALGLFFYVTLPSWYLSRTIDVINIGKSVQYDENNVFEQMRYGAFWGDSYSVSHLSVFCVAIALFFVANWEGKNKWLARACLVIGLVSSIASMHRASMVGSAAAIAVYLYYNHREHKYVTNVKIFVVFLVILIAFIAAMPSFGDRIEQIFELIFNRVDDNMSLDTALKERKYTEQVMESMRFFIFGHGLGAGGVGARAYGFPGISDMQYIKMFFENGLVGAFLFIGLMIRALSRGVKYIKFFITEVSIILFILIAMMGSNSLSIYYFIVFPFWYAVGRLYNDRYLQYLKSNKWI